MTRKELLQFLNISDSTLQRWDRAGLGPPSFRLGGITRYRESSVLAWIDADTETPAASSAA